MLMVAVELNQAPNVSVISVMNCKSAFLSCARTCEISFIKADIKELFLDAA